MGVRGNGAWWALSTLALTLVLGACKEGQEGWSPKKDHPQGEAKTGTTASSGSFTPAEIHRDKPVEIDTSGSHVDASRPAEAASLEETIPAKTVVAKPAAVVAPAPVPAKPVEPKAPAPQVATKSVETSPSPVATGSVTQPGETGDWVMQVNVHRSEAEAKAQIAKLAQQGIPAYAIPVPTGDAALSGNYWRVRVGRFQSRAEAQAYGKSVLEPKGLKFWVDKKSNEAKQGN